MAQQNRYYNNLAQGSFITNVGGLSPSTGSITVQSTINWPTSFPFIVRFEPGTGNEEVGLVTSGAGTAGNPYSVLRGYDGTSAFSHSQGTAIIPGFAQIDFSEPQVHLNLNTSTSGAHGLPASVWGGGTVQSIASAVPTEGQASIIFNNIPQTYSHLLVVYLLGSNGTNADSEQLQCQINGRTGTVYGNNIWSVNPSGSVSGSSSAANHSIFCGYLYQEGTPALGSGWMIIPNYSSSGYHDLLFSTFSGDGGITNGNWSAGGGGSINVVLQVTSLKFFPQTSSGFENAGMLTLYGIM
jgi:hypothetical protein